MTPANTDGRPLRVSKTIGQVRIYKNSDWDEFIVAPIGSTEAGWYHTDDRADAIATARDMDARLSEPEPEPEPETRDELAEVKAERDALLAVVEDLVNGARVAQGDLCTVHWERIDRAKRVLRGLLSTSFSASPELVRHLDGEISLW